MKRLFLLIFLFSNILIKAQNYCNPPLMPTDFFYPNTTSTYTNSGLPYLCGPNTTLYDTLGLGTCRNAFLNNNTVLFFKQTPNNCTAGGSHTFWLKNNSMLNLIGSTGTVTIFYEPLATINNPGGMTITPYTSTCTVVTYQYGPCPLSINEILTKQVIFHVWPNPSSTKINIDLINSAEQYVEIKITNQLGEIVYERKQFPIIEKEIPIDNLSNGYYLIQVKTKIGQQSEKLIVLR
ncbi:MAG TPA: T9SS type A sorting domain-containing protein [Bacteroidia bacterium]|jgi:hypothetical protein|nr:T9SS type A sorting domain-containing protein [Bacteroidia bacterium]